MDLEAFTDSKINEKMHDRELPGGDNILAEIKRRLLQEASDMYVFYMEN
jgi:hypothetical protein